MTANDELRSPSHAPRPHLVERDAELRVLRAAISAACTGAGRLVLVEGEAGIGKSSLLLAAEDDARAAGMTVLRARGGELEHRTVNGVVVDLLAPLLRHPSDRERRLTGLAAAAAPVFGLATDRADALLDTLHGLYWLTVDLATEQPILIAVDDGHWADPASLRYLSYVARRISDLPIAMVVTVRDPDAGEAAELADLRSTSDAVRLRPGRLSRAGVMTVLRASGLDADEAAAEACWTATRGNPLFVHEVATQPHAASMLAAGEPAPEPLSRAVRHRLGLLDPQARRVAEAAAVLGDEATPARVARMSGVDPAAIHAAVRRLTDASVLDRGAAISFSHPIVRAALYDGIPPVSRGDAHRRAAAILDDDQASPAAIAAHLLRAERTGDARVVWLLRRAADAARAQGDAAAAARHLHRALEEPAADGERPGLIAELAAAEAAAGMASAVDRYREAMDVATTDRDRAELELGLGHALIAAADWPAAADAFRRGLALAHGDERLTAKLEADYVAASWVTMAPGPDVEAILDRMEQSASVTPEQRELLTSRAFQKGSAMIGTAPDAAATVLRAIDGVPIEELVSSGQTVELTTGVLLMTDELEAEVQLLDRAIDAVPRTGRFAKLGVYSYCRAWPRYYMGDLMNAAADAEAAVHAHELGWETFFPVASSVLAFCRLERGEIDAASRAIDAIDPTAFAGRIDMEVFVPIARGRILLQQGDASAAATYLLEAGTAAERIGLRTPAPPDWRSWAAIALARSGDRGRATELASELLEITRAWGALWPQAVALRTMGAVTRGRAGIDLLEASVEMARRSPARLEEARSLVKLGEALRREGALRDARGRLAEGIDLAQRLGAVALRERAREELRAAGGRPRRYAVTGRDALTPSETRVAELVAAGRTNRQVAEALFVTPKAVEYHLANAYRKLGITGRGELPAALGDRRPIDARASV